MRRFMMISMTLLACALNMYAQEKGGKGFRCTMGADLTGVIYKGRMGMEISHSIGGNWAVSAASSIIIRNQGIPADGRLRSTVSFQYWPVRPHLGPMLSLGAESSLKKDIRLCASIGYCCHVWKGLIIGLGCNTYLQGITPENNLKLVLYYGL